MKLFGEILIVAICIYASAAGFIGSIGNAINDGANAAEKGISAGATAAENEINVAGNAVNASANAAKNSVSAATNATENGISAGASAAASGINAAGNAVNASANAAENSVNTATNASEKGINAGITAAQNGLNTAGQVLDNLFSVQQNKLYIVRSAEPASRKTAHRGFSNGDTNTPSPVSNDSCYSNYNNRLNLINNQTTSQSKSCYTVANVSGASSVENVNSTLIHVNDLSEKLQSHLSACAAGASMQDVLKCYVSSFDENLKKLDDLTVQSQVAVAYLASNETEVDITQNICISNVIRASKANSTTALNDLEDCLDSLSYATSHHSANRHPNRHHSHNLIQG